MDRRRAAGAGVLALVAAVLVAAVAAANTGSSNTAASAPAATAVTTAGPYERITAAGSTAAPGTGAGSTALAATTTTSAASAAAPGSTADPTATTASSATDAGLVDEPEGPASAARLGPPPTVALPAASSNSKGKGQPSRPVNVPLGAQLACPLAGPFAHYVDWLAPRAGGRVHLGHDLIAPMGTPIQAISDGYVRAVDRINSFDGVHDLGGITITIDTAAGDIFYYAHMNDIDPSLTVGSPILTGEVLGHVGQTGDAIWSVPHLHLGWRPGRGQWADGYQLVTQLCQGLITK